MIEPEVILGIVDSSVKRNAVFGDLLTTENKSYLINNSIIHPAETGQVLCRQNDLDNTLFLIVDGEVEVSIETDGNKMSLGKLGSGELVGEIASLLLIPRIATVTVARPSVILEIPYEIFSGIISENMDIKNIIQKRCRDRITETSLRCVPVFNDMDNQSFSELCYISSLKKAYKGDIIANEGKLERQLYVICSGTARVYITIDGVDITIALLRPGDYFGEYSVFNSEDRRASVSALTDLQLIVLEGESFQSFIEYNEDIEEKIKLTSSNRIQSLNQIKDSTAVRQSAESRLNKIQHILNI